MRWIVSRGSFKVQTNRRAASLAGRGTNERASHDLSLLIMPESCSMAKFMPTATCCALVGASCRAQLAPVATLSALCDRSHSQYRSVDQSIDPVTHFVCCLGAATDFQLRHNCAATGAKCRLSRLTVVHLGSKVLLPVRPVFSPLRFVLLPLRSSGFPAKSIGNKEGHTLLGCISSKVSARPRNWAGHFLQQ